MGDKRVSRGRGEDLGGSTIPYRQSSVDARRARFGRANQMSHETEGRIQRKAMLERMAEGKRAAQAKHQKKVAQTTGMNAGTVGGLRRNM